MADVEVIYDDDLVTVNVSECDCSSDLSGYVQDTRTLTINGTSYDLSANRSWDIFPYDGLEVTTSRFYTSGDRNKILVITADNVNLSFQVGSTPFQNGDILIIICRADNCTFTTTDGGTPVELLGSATDNESIILKFIIDEFQFLSSGRILDVPDANAVKTLSKYFHDNIGTSGFVPYSGATANVDLGSFNLEAQSINVKGTNGQGHIHLRHQASDASATANSTVLFANSAGDLKYKNDGGYYTSFVTSANSADRAYTFPNASGTVALTSDLSPYLTSVTAASTYQTILVSGTSIKTVNGTSLLGSGDIVISASAALSAITAASGSNTIDNANNSQVWQWNSLTGTGLKLSNSFTGTQTGSILLEVENTGTLGAGQNTTALKVTNTKSSNGGISNGIDISVGGGTANGINITNSATLGVGINFVAGMAGGGIQMNANRINLNSSTEYIQSSTTVNYVGGSKRTYFASTSTAPFGVASDINGNGLITIARPNSTTHQIIFSGDMSGSSFRSELTSNNTIRSTGGSLTFTGNTGLAGGFGSFTPTEIMTVYGTNSNVGIGTTTPTSVALLELTSTTKGFLPPRMTATQASAITAVDGLMLYVTDTNGTFTSIGFWGRENGTWIKL